MSTVELPKVAHAEFNHEITCEININPTGTAEYASLCEAFKDIAIAMNETVYKAKYLSDGGYSSALVTGLNPTVSQTGDFIKNDPACQYLNKARWKTGAGRVTDIKMVRAGEEISVPVTLTSIQVAGGTPENPTSVSIVIEFNGKPNVTETDFETGTTTETETTTTT